MTRVTTESTFHPRVHEPPQGGSRALLAGNLRVLRAVRGWSQETLAEESGLHRTYVGAIERAERNVSLDNLERLAAAFQMSVSALLSDLDGNATSRALLEQVRRGNRGTLRSTS